VRERVSKHPKKGGKKDEYAEGEMNESEPRGKRKRMNGGGKE